MKKTIILSVLSVFLLSAGVSFAWQDKDKEHPYNVGGHKYKYDLTKPSDRLRYGVDPGAQLRDSVDPIQKLHQSITPGHQYRGRERR